MACSDGEKAGGINVHVIVICGHREGIAMATAALSHPVETGGREMWQREDKCTSITKTGHSCKD